ncbi:hypothetical protein B0A49_00328 [Cryomyces minteri]|uniref:Uncharacterized protein n=1 Tax=Cryomyces minteri TaxID=331657 RepID=A0A4U0XVM0_9PEZI|nr:hypothetical protein B0A49_00328 [Cryomyces minteri]
MSPAPRQLSKNDSQVFARVFSPESAIQVPTVLINPNLPAERDILPPLHAQLRKQELVAIRLVESFECSPSTHSSKDSVYQRAIALLNQLIRDHPNYASARNNRAQLIRWRYGDRHAICETPTRFESSVAAATGTALTDLHTAIALASPLRPTDAVSPFQGKMLGQAYTQLAALYHAASKDLNEDSSAVAGSELDAEWSKPFEQYVGWSSETFEEEGSKCFYLGGSYGNEVGKAMARHTNPYAKLCGSIVKEAMRKEYAIV